MEDFTYRPVKFPIIFLRNNDVAMNSRPTYSESMEHSHENQIWNRAAMDGGGPTPRKGDTMLASLLRVHGMIMSGGIEHALDTLTQQQYKVGVEGYRYFGLLGAAIVLEQQGSKGLQRISISNNSMKTTRVLFQVMMLSSVLCR